MHHSRTPPGRAGLVLAVALAVPATMPRPADAQDARTPAAIPAAPAPTTRAANAQDPRTPAEAAEAPTTRAANAQDAPEVLATNRLSVDAPVTGFAAVDDAIVIRAGTEVIRVGGSAD